MVSNNVKSLANLAPTRQVISLEELIDRAGQVLLSNDADAKQQFVNQFNSQIPILIRLLQRNCVTASNDLVTASWNCVAELSGLQLDSRCIETWLQDNEFVQHVSDILQNESSASATTGQSESNWQLTHFALVFCCNLSRNERVCNKLYEQFATTRFLDRLLQCLMSKPSFDRHKELYTSLLLNLTALQCVRSSLAASDRIGKVADLFVLQAGDFQPIETRLRLFEVIKNLCFETSCHETLLRNSDFVVQLVWPVTGPTADEMDQEDNEKLLLDLQFLDEQKVRSSSPELKLVVLECLLLLCATQQSRQKLRDLHVYFILRAYHRVENDKHLAKAIEDVVDILIRDEQDYQEVTDFHQAEITQEMKQTFEKWDKALLE